MWISKASVILSVGIRQISSFSTNPNSVTMVATTMRRGSSSSLTMSSHTFTYTPLPSIAPMVNDAHQIYSTHITHPYSFRLNQLRGIERLVRDNTEELAHAIEKDLGQGPMFPEMFEFNSVISRSRYAQSNLKEWMSTKRTTTPYPLNLFVPVHSEMDPIPRGVALIITPWNLPIQLTLTPLIDALSAGNVCVLKMSETCVHCTRILTELLTNGKYIDPTYIQHCHSYFLVVHVQ